MPTAEGTFLKVGGDPLYYSEINRLAGAGRIYAVGSFVPISGTSEQRIGSIYIGVGSLSNPSTLLLNINTNKSLQDSYTFSVSGLSNNTKITLGSISAGVTTIGWIMFDIGSMTGSYLGGLHGEMYFEDDNLASTPNAFVYATRRSLNLYPNSGLVIGISGVINNGSPIWYTLKSLYTSYILP